VTRVADNATVFYDTKCNFSSQKNKEKTRPRDVTSLMKPRRKPSFCFAV